MPLFCFAWLIASVKRLFRINSILSSSSGFRKRAICWLGGWTDEASGATARLCRCRQTSNISRATRSQGRFVERVVLTPYEGVFSPLPGASIMEHRCWVIRRNQKPPRVELITTPKELGQQIDGSRMNMPSGGALADGILIFPWESSAGVNGLRPKRNARNPTQCRGNPVDNSKSNPLCSIRGGSYPILRPTSAGNWNERYGAGRQAT